MNNFKDWCNKNPGYLTFWGLLIGFIGIILTIIFSNKVEINPQGFWTFLNSKIPIPLYILILSIILIGITFYRIRKRPIITKTNELILHSDNKTIFIESPTYPNLSKKVPTQICDRQPWTNHSNKYPVLINSHWISHNMLISNTEAIEGGIYIFERDFELNANIKKVQSANLHYLVDDFCRLYVNGSLVKNIQGLDRSSSYSNLHSFDIRSYLNQGQNNIRFEIENCNFRDQMKPTTPFFKAKDKGNLNPYGIIYTVMITLNVSSI